MRKIKKNKQRTILGAKILRKEMTVAEILLWKYLSNKGMCGFKFRRQHPIKGFILDFFCPQKKLAIEIDGDIHDYRKEYDLARQQILEYFGIEFLRFKNMDILKNTDMVLKIIKRKLIPIKCIQKNQSSESTYPLSAKRRGEERGEDV